MRTGAASSGRARTGALCHILEWNSQLSWRNLMRVSEFLACGLVVLVGTVIAVGQGANAPPKAAQPAPPAAAAPAGPSQKERLSYGVGFYLGEEAREGLTADQINVERELVIKGFV